MEFDLLFLFRQLWDVDESLNNTLLRIDGNGRIVVNLDHTVRLLIRESDCLVKMDVPLPIVCHSLYAKKNYFTLVNDSLQVSLQFQYEVLIYFVLSYLLVNQMSGVHSPNSHFVCLLPGSIREVLSFNRPTS